MTDRKCYGSKVINPDSRIFFIDETEDFMSGTETCSKAGGQEDHDPWGEGEPTVALLNRHGVTLSSKYLFYTQRLMLLLILVIETSVCNG